MLDLIMLAIAVMTVIGVICLVRLSLGLNDALVDLKCHYTEGANNTRRAILDRLRLGDYADFQRVVEEMAALREDLARAETKHERATAQCAKLAARLKRAEAKIERLKAEAAANGVVPCDGRLGTTTIVYGGGNTKPLFDTKVSAVEKAILRGVVDDANVQVIVSDNDIDAITEAIVEDVKESRKARVCATCLFHGDPSKYPCPSCENGLYHRERSK